MSPTETVDIRFTEFRSAKEKITELLTDLKRISGSVLPAHLARLRDAFSCTEAENFYGKEVRLNEGLSDGIAAIDRVMEEIGDEASLLYQIERLNRSIGFFRSY